MASWLTEQSGLTFSVPDADYSDRPIPHFNHSGTGYQLLDNLGQAFGITDYVWYQLPDGGVYTGGAEKALFADRPVEIPHEFNQGAAGGNSMTLPLVQSLRPGVELNGERVTKVHLQNDTMAVTWTPRNRATGKALQKTPVQRQIESHYPELASGLHLPKFGRVMNPVEAVKSGNFSDPFRPRYAVDVQLLDADGNPDKETPVYSAVPLPVPMAGIGGNDETDIAGSQTVTTGKDLIEKIGQIRKSVAAVKQQIIAPVVWIGSGTINVAQLMLDTLDVVKELAEQTASHTHSNTGAPTNAGAIRNTGTKADTLNGKYSPVIGK